MKELLNELKNVQSAHCVTVILNTHRTHPDNARDPILLKNLLVETEARLLAIMDKRSADELLGRLELIAEEIDHQHNLESLVLFANENLARYTRLPVAVTDRVVIDGTFATRDLVRTLHSEHAYYVLVLDRHKARLIEAFADKPVREIGGDFPMEYGDLYSTNKETLTQARGQDNLIEEFFNRVDKAFQEQWKSEPHPLVLSAEERNVAHYRKVADRDHLVAVVAPSHADDKAHQIVTRAWASAKPAFDERNLGRVAELRQAVAAQSFLSDLNDIWKAVREGRGRTLFVKQGFFQPAQLDGDSLVPLEKSDLQVEGYIDDAIDEIIEIVYASGGDAVFVTDDTLADFQGLALITRW